MSEVEEAAVMCAGQREGRGGLTGRLTVQAWFELVLGLMVVLVLVGAGAGAQVIAQTMQNSAVAER